MQFVRRLFAGGDQGHAPLAGVIAQSAGTSDLLADVALVERFSRDWAANAKFYAGALNGLRAAACRIVAQSELSTNEAVSPELAARLGAITDEAACLARQPLFFPEMFHGQRLLPDGTFADLSQSDRIHFLPGGILLDGDRAAIAEIYQRIFRKRHASLRVVEIGSAVGRGSTRIGGEFIRQHGGVLYCIDPWSDSNWYYAFLANLQIFKLESIVVPIRSPSVDAAKLFDDGSLDAVFVDGSHIYRDVLADIDAWTSKLRKGGVLFGHDLHDLPSRFDRSELLSVSGKNNTDVNYRNAQGEIVRTNVHPGVILAVQDRFGDDVEQFPGSVVWARPV
jgi:hypothetical protein